jgi:hypothetical protein
MAIEQYGESILAGVRSRQAEDRKRREKDALKSALTGLGVTIGYKVGNQVLANNMSNFLNNENIFSAKAQYKAALNNKANIYGLKKQIDASGLSTVDFLAENKRPFVEARLKETVPHDRVGPAGAFNALVTAEARKMAEAEAEAFNKALEAADNLGDEEDFINMVALNSKEAKATNILDAGFRSFSRLFAGNSAQDLEEKALDAIVNGPMSQNAEKLNIFMEEYNRTKDIQGAKNFADVVVPEVSEEERFLESTKIEYVELGDNIYKRETVQRTDRNTGEVKTEQKKPELAVEFEDPEETEAAAVKSLMSTFNYGTNARDELTTPAFAQFVRDAKALNINPEQPKTIEEYQQLAELYNARTVDKNNLRNPFQEEQIINFQEILLNDAVNIQAFLAIMKTGTEEEKQEAIRGVAGLINNLMMQAEQAVTSTPWSSVR